MNSKLMEISFLIVAEYRLDNFTEKPGIDFPETVGFKQTR